MKIQISQLLKKISYSIKQIEIPYLHRKLISCKNNFKLKKISLLKNQQLVFKNSKSHILLN